MMPEIVVTNGSAVSLSKLKPVSIEEFEKTCVDRCSSGKRLSALLVLPAPKERTFLLAAVIADDPAHSLSLISTALVEGGSYPSLTGRIPQAQAFEREIYEDHGLKPEGHPWLKPLRRHSGSNGSSHPFFPVSGESVHEVAVGPVHAGIIEPGHFRFQCHGEEIFHLEIQLGYQHRGAEKLLLSSLPARRAVIAESIAGDTVIGHGTAYCMAVESLSDTVVPKRGNAIRAIALELERVSNHVGDLGALCNDVGFLPGAAYFGRLRGEFLNVLMEMSGNRYGRGLLVPGGVRFDIDDAMGTRIIQRLQKAETDLTDVVHLVFGRNSVVARFERTGVVSLKLAQELGLVGVVARSSGCDRDVRRDHPFGGYKSESVPVALRTQGDVMARAVVRWLETKNSLRLLFTLISNLPSGPLSEREGSPGKNLAVVSMVEGWRGEIVHVAATDSEGELRVYKVVDPSFHNWFGLAMVLRGNEISDFPLCNKSFNLSYAGHDL